MPKKEVTKTKTQRAKDLRTPQKGHDPENRKGRLRCPNCGMDCVIETEYSQKVQRCHACGTSFGLTAMS